MDRERWQRVSEVFEAVADLEGAALERALAERCGNDDALRREVESLLAAESDSASWLAGLTARVGIPNPEAESILNAPGRQIGAWRLVRQIGRGGMGVVYLAERADGQFEMQAALKALPVGLVTPGAVARFERERGILAGLDHPNIARLVDGGVTPEGTPFYVMEYVEGLPLHRYCNERDPPLDRRLRLFERIAEAVAYAHRHLVIHRDIKPANVQVTDRGEPKLLDFGVAKLVDTEGDPAGTATQLGQRRMTPAYTAPELIQGEPATTACDVYSLGVVLYELLAGAPPFEPGFFEQPGWTDRLTTERPPPPSAAASDPAVRQRLKGDLDNIVAMAMHPDPTRRYTTVNALLADLERYRRHLPVSARPDTAGYRASRFLRRHAVGAALSGLAALALILGTAVSLWQAERAAQAAAEAQRQSRAALAAQRSAERARKRAVSTRDFLVELFQATVPDVPPGEMPDTESLLAAGVQRALEAEGLDPVLRADMLTAVGEIYQDTGQHDEARRVLDRARELATGARERAPEIYARTMAAWAAHIVQSEGPSEAVPILESLVAWLREHAPGSPAALEARLELGWTLALDRQDDRALEVIQAVDREARGREDLSETFRRNLKNDLANLLFINGKYAAADPLYNKLVRIQESLTGPQHRELAVKLGNAAMNDSLLGRFEQAEDRFIRALEIHHAIGDSPSQTHAAAHTNYAALLASVGRLEDALEEYRTSVRVWSEYNGLDSPEDSPQWNFRIASAYTKVGHWEEAEPYLEKAVEDVSGPDGMAFLRFLTLRQLAQARCVAGDAAAGREHLATLRAESGDREFVPRTQAAILEAEAYCHHAAGDPEAALQVLDEAARVAEDMAPGEVAMRSRQDLLRARLHVALDDPESAAAALSSGRRALEAAGLEDHPFITRIRDYREQAL